MILYYFTKRATLSLRHNSETLVNWMGLEDAIRIYRGDVTIIQRGLEKVAEWYSGNGHHCRRHNAFTLLDDSHTPPRLIHNGFPIDKIAFLNRAKGGTPQHVIDVKSDIYAVEWYPAPHTRKVMEGAALIVFWKQCRENGYSVRTYDWRCYLGTARLVRGILRIYPCNGKRRELTEFVAFNDRVSKPPTVFSSDPALGGGVDHLACAGEIAEHLPPLYIDAHGNIRKTNSDLTLVLPGPDWNDVKEDEFQRAIEVLF